VSDNSMSVRFMSLDNILGQLSSLRDSSADLAKGKDADEIWQMDVEAIEAATAILSALQDEGINDAEQVKDLIHDYRAQARQCKEMHRKHNTPAKVIHKDGIFHCPECNSRVAPRHSYCHRCGKRLGGW